MKRFSIILFFTFIVWSVSASEKCIPVNVLVPDKVVPPEANNLLEAKLTQIATNYGMADNGISNRFYLSANVLIISKDIAPVNPPKVSMKMDVILYFGDALDGKLYGTLPISIIGVGLNENKAFIQAFKNIPVRSDAYSHFFDEMEDKVLDYYSMKGPTIIRDAEFMAKSGSYDEAIASLLSVPEACGEIAISAREACYNIYKLKIDKEGAALYKQAKDLWSVKKDEQTALDVVDILSRIDIESSSMAKSQELVKSIETTLDSRKKQQEELLRQEREFKMKRYEDELEIRRQRMKDEASLEKARIDAMKTAAKKIRHIDVKYVTNVIRGWF